MDTRSVVGRTVARSAWKIPKPGDRVEESAHMNVKTVRPHPNPSSLTLDGRPVCVPFHILRRAALDRNVRRPTVNAGNGGFGPPRAAAVAIGEPQEAVPRIATLSFQARTIRALLRRRVFSELGASIRQSRVTHVRRSFGSTIGDSADRRSGACARLHSSKPSAKMTSVGVLSTGTRLTPSNQAAPPLVVAPVTDTFSVSAMVVLLVNWLARSNAGMTAGVAAGCHAIRRPPLSPS